MSINALIRSTVLPIVPVCDLDPYSGSEPEYCTFVYTKMPGLFADDKPIFIRYYVQLHYYCPLGQNSINVISEITQALLDAGFCYPDVLNETDEVSQHHVFEFEYVEFIGDDNYDEEIS